MSIDHMQEFLEHMIVWPALEQAIEGKTPFYENSWAKPIPFKQTLQNYKTYSTKHGFEGYSLLRSQERYGFGHLEGRDVALNPNNKEKLIATSASIEVLYGSPSISEEEYAALQQFSLKNNQHYLSLKAGRNLGDGGHTSAQIQKFFQAVESGIFETLSYEEYRSAVRKAAETHFASKDAAFKQKLNARYSEWHDKKEIAAPAVSQPPVTATAGNVKTPPTNPQKADSSANMKDLLAQAIDWKTYGKLAFSNQINTQNGYVAPAKAAQYIMYYALQQASPGQMLTTRQVYE